MVINLRRLIRSASYFLWLMREIFLSSVAVTKLIWDLRSTPNAHYLKITLAQSSDLAKLLYSSSITLTPGTITTSTQQDHLIVHALNSGFAKDLQSGVMEEKITELFSENL